MLFKVCLLIAIFSVTFMNSEEIHIVINEHGRISRSNNRPFFESVARHQKGIYTVRFIRLLETEPIVQLSTKYWGPDGKSCIFYNYFFTAKH